MKLVFQGLGDVGEHRQACCSRVLWRRTCALPTLGAKLQENGQKSLGQDDCYELLQLLKREIQKLIRSS